MSIIHDFLSFYVQAYMASFMIYFILIKSFPLRISKQRALILGVLCANYIPIADTLSIIYIGEGIVKYSAAVYWILKLSNFIAQFVMIFFIMYVFEKEWYRCYWWAIILLFVLFLPAALFYLPKFIYFGNTVIFRKIHMSLVPEYLLYLLITLLCGIIFVYLGKLVKKIKKLDMISKWYWYILYTFWGTLIYFCDKNYSASEFGKPAIGYINYIVVFFVFMLIFLFFVINIYDKKVLKTENNLLKQQNEMQYANYLAMQHQENEIHKLYHDIGNHIETIRVLINNGDNQEAKEYSDELLKKYSEVKKEYYCSNKIINAVLSQKFKLCEDNKILSDYELRIPDNLSVKDIDLMCIFANLLDNAIESCQRNNGFDNYINLKATVVGNYFVVKVINSKVFEDIDNNKTHHTWKQDRSLHGYGLKILKEIVQRYDGKSEFKNNIDNFSAMVMLKME